MDDPQFWNDISCRKRPSVGASITPFVLYSTRFFSSAWYGNRHWRRIECKHLGWAHSQFCDCRVGYIEKIGLLSPSTLSYLKEEKTINSTA